jgi:hypothetical protein
MRRLKVALSCELRLVALQNGQSTTKTFCFFIFQRKSLISHRLKLSVFYFLKEHVFRTFPNVTFIVDLHDTTEQDR